jgi:hypothetical protein
LGTGGVAGGGWWIVRFILLSVGHRPGVEDGLCCHLLRLAADTLDIVGDQMICQMLPAQAELDLLDERKRSARRSINSGTSIARSVVSLTAGMVALPDWAIAFSSSKLRESAE